ncbi:TIR-like protein FxsC [Streptomyces sp. NPDC050516]|uniref:TIR-like protein FxsC n=1 Tax=Streptomyces sp. NPDC050516 TaxID=3365621 RepID=UPI00379A4FA6
MQSVGAGGDEQKPYFFLSYAHTPKSDPKERNPNLWVERFFRDLCAHVMQLTSLPAGSAGFMDQQMQPGEGWQERLSDALAFSKVFVPLYSPRYFLSEQCGREWFAFSSRAAAQNPRNSHNNSNPVTGIVPALWVPVPTRQLPQPAERLQFNHATFGDEYADEGFYGLIKLNYLRDQYERAVYQLAKRIVSVAQQIRLEPGDPHQDYAKVPPAFGPAGEPARELEVSVLACSRSTLPTGRSPDCYGSEALDWNPYHPASSRPLADHTVDVVRGLDEYTVHLSDFEAEPGRLLDSEPPAGPGLLLLDRWALDARSRRELMAQLCATPRPWISVMVPGSEADPQTRAHDGELSRQTDDALATRVDESDGHRTPSAGLPTLEAFSKAIPGAVKSAVRYYEANAPTYPPPGSGGPMPRVLPRGIGYGVSGPGGRGQSTDQDKNNGDKAEGSSDD